MKLEKGLHPINYIMSWVRSEEEFSLKDISEKIGEENEAIAKNILTAMSFQGYVRFDKETQKYIPHRKVNYLERTEIFKR